MTVDYVHFAPHPRAGDAITEAKTLARADGWRVRTVSRVEEVPDGIAHPAGWRVTLAVVRADAPEEDGTRCSSCLHSSDLHGPLGGCRGHGSLCPCPLSQRVVMSMPGGAA